jgi:hypothetical protein
MAVGEAFMTAQAAKLYSYQFTAAQITALAAVTTGSMTIVYNNSSAPVAQNFSPMNFTGVTTIEGIATIVNAAAGGSLSCIVKTLPGGTKILRVTTNATGDGKTITFAVPYLTGSPAAQVGVDVSAMLNLTALTGAQACNGYTPTGIDDEIQNIKNAAKAAGQNIYGWCLELAFRSPAYQTVAAAWALGQQALMPLVSNDVTAFDPTYTTDIGSEIKAMINRRGPCIYYDNPAYYPDMSILAYMLSVNYAAQNSTVNAKFKSLPGIPTVVITTTQWLALQAKGYNTFTLMDNGAQVFREGTTEDPSYWLDSIVNFDNFMEDLNTNVYNVFLRNAKVGYTRVGQMLLVDACSDTAQQYVFNGTFADRDVQDLSQKSGVRTIPAYQINPTPLAQGNPATRVCPPIVIICQEEEAINSVAVNVGVVA